MTLGGAGKPSGLPVFLFTRTVAYTTNSLSSLSRPCYNHPVRLARSTPAGIWFRVAVLLTLAQVFLSVCSGEWRPHDFLVTGTLLAATGAWFYVERKRLTLEQRR